MGWGGRVHLAVNYIHVHMIYRELTNNISDVVVMALEGSIDIVIHSSVTVVEVLYGDADVVGLVEIVA